MRKNAFLASAVTIGVVLSFCVGSESGQERISTTLSPLPDLDARGLNGIRDLTRIELEQLLSKNRPLTKAELLDLDRGCPGFTCLYQGMGQTRWPESAPATIAFPNRADALKRRCPDGKQNFVFLKQGCWLGNQPPKPNPVTGEVPLDSVTRSKPGFYSFNYAVYFPATQTYAWMNHREFGFPLNQIRPQKAYLSPFPPPLDEETRPAQIYCSTCR